MTGTGPVHHAENQTVSDMVFDHHPRDAINILPLVEGLMRGHDHGRGVHRGTVGIMRHTMADRALALDQDLKDTMVDETSHLDGTTMVPTADKGAAMEISLTAHRHMAKYEVVVIVEAAAAVGAVRQVEGEKSGTQETEVGGLSAIPDQGDHQEIRGILGDLHCRWVRTLDQDLGMLKDEEEWRYPLNRVKTSLVEISPCQLAKR